MEKNDGDERHDDRDWEGRGEERRGFGRRREGRGKERQGLRWCKR